MFPEEKPDVDAKYVYSTLAFSLFPTSSDFDRGQSWQRQARVLELFHIGHLIVTHFRLPSIIAPNSSLSREFLELLLPKLIIFPVPHNACYDWLLGTLVVGIPQHFCLVPLDFVT